MKIKSKNRVFQRPQRLCFRTSIDTEYRNKNILNELKEYLLSKICYYKYFSVNNFKRIKR
jgi:hypothetical protein